MKERPMPIRPEKRHLYPPPAEWAALRASILERATWCCECAGECGRAHAGGACIVPNRLLVARYVRNERETWHEHEHSSNCLAAPCADDEPPGSKVVRVVLTIAHLDHDPTNNAPANLRAFCQRCHLRHDAAEHARTRAATKAAKAGQLTIPR
jgi:hypothetical protein